MQPAARQADKRPGQPRQAGCPNRASPEHVQQPCRLASQKVAAAWSQVRAAMAKDDEAEGEPLRPPSAGIESDAAADRQLAPVLSKGWGALHKARRPPSVVAEAMVCEAMVVESEIPSVARRSGSRSSAWRHPCRACSSA